MHVKSVDARDSKGLIAKVWRRAAYLCAALLLLSAQRLCAQELTLLYSGETHAMLYQCSCPKETDGGVARRATLVKQLRQSDPHALLLDSGGFFAGGLLDEYTQNTQLDEERTRVQLKAMKLMNYDAAALGDDEFNFGKEFLEQQIESFPVPLLSCNIRGAKEGLVKPYLVKEISGLRVGIIGVTSLTAQQKAGGLTLSDPIEAVRSAVAQLKERKVSVIILLSHLGEYEDMKLLGAIPDISVLVVGHSRSKEEPFSKVGSTLVLRPTWQGRRLGKALLTVKNNTIVDSKVEEIRLSDKIADDKGVFSILPRCFADANCKKEGMIGSCQNPGSMSSQCLFAETVKIPLTVITVKDCSICNTERIVAYLKKQLPGVMITTLNYPDPAASSLVKELGIEGLPVYLVGKEVERDRNFDAMKQNIELRGNYYILKPQFTGISYFPARKKIKGRIDLFISLYDKGTSELLEGIKDFNPVVHFLAVPGNDGFDAKGGGLEVEECLRSVCVQRYYPKEFWSYIRCRSKNSNSSWWDECLPSADARTIKDCAMGKEGQELLKANTALNKEAKVMFGPTYLLDNQEIFGTTGVPTKEDFKKIFGK